MIDRSSFSFLEYTSFLSAPKLNVMYLLVGTLLSCWGRVGRGVYAEWGRGVYAEWGRGVYAEWGRGVYAEWGRGVYAEWGRGVYAEWGSQKRHCLKHKIGQIRWGRLARADLVEQI
jgi:hypothetical protein